MNIIISTADEARFVLAIFGAADAASDSGDAAPLESLWQYAELEVAAINLLGKDEAKVYWWWGYGEDNARKNGRL